MGGYRNPAEMPVVVPVIPAFSGERPKCPKCTHQGLTFNKFQSLENVMLRRCMDCEYQWKERPADG